MIFQRECKLCGKPFETNKSKKVYCTWECMREAAKIRAREYARNYQKKHDYPNRCMQCGKVFRAGRNTLYCSPECKRAAREMMTEKKSAEPAKKTEPKKQAMTLSQVARAAREAGMSYGEYVRKMEVAG